MTWTAGTYERFIYDDNYNRAGSDGTRNITQDPFGNEAGVDDYFATNKANEYTSVVRGGSGTSVSHDAAGNMTAVPVIPGAGPSAGTQVTASITWDAFNRARGIQAGDNTTFAYCYDAFGRRIAQWDAETADNLMGRRYIWDGWSTIQERIFSNYEVETEPGSEEWIEMVPTEASAHSKAERVYVNGASIDEPLFVAIDGDLDGYIGGEDPAVFASVNLPEYEKPEDTIQQVTGRNDFAYYYLNNRMGSITALLARNLEATTPLELGEEGHASARILEYYRYSAYGSVTVLPVHDDGSAYSKVASGLYDATGNGMGSGSRKAWDKVEDTPLDLADNNTIMLLRREADGTYSHLSARADYGRVSQFGNTFTFTARRQDAHTGLMYYRYRLYEPVSGRFVGRDPLGYVDGGNAYQGLLNGPGKWGDVFGLWAGFMGWDPDTVWTHMASHKGCQDKWNELAECGWRFCCNDPYKDPGNPKEIALKGNSDNCNIDVTDSGSIEGFGAGRDIQWRNDDWLVDFDTKCIYIDRRVNANAADSICRLIDKMKCGDFDLFEPKAMIMRPNAGMAMVFNNTDWKKRRRASMVDQLSIAQKAKVVEIIINLLGPNPGAPVGMALRGAGAVGAVGRAVADVEKARKLQEILDRLKKGADIAGGGMSLADIWGA